MVAPESEICRGAQLSLLATALALALASPPPPLPVSRREKEWPRRADVLVMLIDRPAVAVETEEW